MNEQQPNYWRELFAHITLKTVLPEEFSDIELSDKPDLIKTSSQLGIEVVFATDQKEEQLNSYYKKFLDGKAIAEVPSKGLSNFRSHFYDVIIDKDANTISAYKKDFEPFNINIIFQAIDKKMKKLNSGLYNYSDNLYLYVQTFKCSGDMADFSTAESILKYITNLKYKYNLTFKEVFYDCIFVLYRLNVESLTINKIDLSDYCDDILKQYDSINKECDET